MLTIVKYYEDQKEFSNASAAKALQMHLTAVSLFEKQNASEKVIKHLQGFKVLLDHQ